MRDRLVELILECSTFTPEYAKQARLHAEYVAQHLLNAGVIVPPCKVGQTVYAILSKKVQEYIVHAIEYKENVITVKCHSWLAEREGLLHKHIAYFDMTKFGKTVFLTREAAEKAIAERREE